MPAFDPSDDSETVLLGCLVNEHLRLWRSDGRAECVRVLQPESLRALVACGLAPRTSVEPGRFREVGRLDAGGVLVVGNRPFAVESCDDPTVSKSLSAAAIDMFAAAAEQAIARGEHLLVEPGGWDVTAETFAIASARKDPSGEWFVHVEAVPAPRRPSWPEPPAGESGWGIAAPADPDSIAATGALVGEAVSMWARSPLDVVLTFGRQPDGPWPPQETPAGIERMLAEARVDVDELLATRRMTRALDLSAQTSVHFNHNTFPVYFTGDLRSRLVLVHTNPQQPDRDTATYEGDFEYRDFDEYIERHRRFGYYHWEAGDRFPSPAEYKQARFLRHWDIVEFADAANREDERTNVARAVDQALQLELIPYGSAKFPVDRLPLEVLTTRYDGLMRAITAYPRDYVILCGPMFDPLLELYIIDREDHSFRLPTSKGTSRVEFRFSNLLLDFGGGAVSVGLAPNFASPGVPIDAYGRACRERYRSLTVGGAPANEGRAS